MTETKEIERETRQIAEAIGKDVRALRRTRGLTLQALADKINRSVGYVSQVERGLSNLGVDDLRKLGAALNVPIGFFLEHHNAHPSDRGIVVRADARRKVGTREEGFTEELLSPDMTGTFEMLRTEIAPGASSKHLIHRPTEEAAYLVSGTLEIWIEDRHYELTPGDAFRFHDQNVRWHNPSNEPAILVWVVAPPVY
ncbi:XRE family transcriptional regulator [Parvibaculaceae bacterium PLY_AMNH_Bact1]|nr:XRE family transcriptional regulator [Parvibaculaceae bacterium PLY_AMNH_Bact1]